MKCFVSFIIYKLVLNFTKIITIIAYMYSVYFCLQISKCRKIYWFDNEQYNYG